MIAVCTGETRHDTMVDALVSLAVGTHIATMEPWWWEAAREARVPRMFFNEKLPMMQFCLSRKAIMLYANDGDVTTHEMVASFHAMGVHIWRVMGTGVVPE